MFSKQPVISPPPSLLDVTLVIRFRMKFLLVCSSIALCALRNDVFRMKKLQFTLFLQVLPRLLFVVIVIREFFNVIIIYMAYFVL